MIAKSGISADGGAIMIISIYKLGNFDPRIDYIENEKIFA